MRVVNIVDSAEMVNYGVWHAAVSNAEELNKRGIRIELWYPSADPIKSIDPTVTQVSLPFTSRSTLQKLIVERDLDPQEDIIVTHGCWQYPTRWGYFLARRGFKWVYVPHGMLEPWSMQQKKWKKSLFFYLFERRMASRAKVVRAVSQREKINLSKFFPAKETRFMPNCIKVIGVDKSFPSEPRRYLFLSRLHAKKNLLALARAWVSSTLNNNGNYQLFFAGPDQGELPGLQQYLQQSNNIIYTGSVYGQQKEELIKSSTFYVLPSFSEGLPSSLLEAMSAGLVPLITEGCNLPEVFTMELGVRLSTNWESIKNVLEDTAAWKKQDILHKSARCKTYIDTHFTLDSVTEEQVILFRRLLND
jgi:glycosyltransferase involved in cell wall biosynthesis